MYKTIDEVQKALMSRMDACKEAGIDCTSEAAAEFYRKDALTQKLITLFNLYYNAQSESKIFGYVGVGCITFAESALIEAQMDEEIL